jgi:hypothetical protein
MRQIVAVGRAEHDDPRVVLIGCLDGRPCYRADVSFAYLGLVADSGMGQAGAD